MSRQENLTHAKMRNYNVLRFLCCAILVSTAVAIDLRPPSAAGPSLSNELSRLSHLGLRKWAGVSLVAQNSRHRDAFAFLTPTSSLLLVGDQLRGGSEVATETEEDKEEKEEDAVESDEEEEDVADDASEEEEVEESYDTEDEYDEEEEEEEETQETSTEVEQTLSEFVEPLVASPMLQLYATIGVMMLSKKIDLYNPTVVRIARYV